MSEYFKPLRRKIGVLTLTVAIASAVWWARSFTTRDTFRVHLTKSAFAVISSRSRLSAWYFPNLDYSIIRLPDWSSWSIPREPTSDEHNAEPIDSVTVTWKFRGLGFGLGAQSEPGMNSTVVMVAYLPVVVLFTLFSSYLLLSKPRVGPMKRAVSSHWPTK